MTYADLAVSGIYGLLAGFASGVISWRRKYPDDSFDFWKMAPTLAVSGVAGLVVGLQGLTVSDATMGPIITMMISAGADSLIGNALKWLKKHWDEM